MELLVRHLPLGVAVVSNDSNPMLFSNSGHRGWFERRLDVARLTACMRQDVDYLLLDMRALHRIRAHAQGWGRLQRELVEVERTRHYSLWRKRDAS